MLYMKYIGRYICMLWDIYSRMYVVDSFSSSFLFLFALPAFACRSLSVVSRSCCHHPLKRCIPKECWLIFKVEVEQRQLMDPFLSFISSIIFRLGLEM